jgi:hypothetical protein
LPRLALNSRSVYVHLLSSWDYKREPPCPVYPEHFLRTQLLGLVGEAHEMKVPAGRWP